MIKYLLPKTLLVRGMLIVVLPVLLMQAITIYVFFDRHLDNVNRHARQAFASEASFLVALVEESYNQHRTIAYMQQKQTAFTLLFRKDEGLPQPLPAAAFRDLHSALQSRLTYPFYVTRAAKDIEIGIAIPSGLVILRSNAKRIENQTVDIFVLWVSSAGIALTLIALIFLRNQIRPIRELAEVAERFGKGQDVSHFKPSGAAEVRRAGRAFLVMRERITRQIQSRTEMLAGISHDLRTPLTRMKLELALLQGHELAEGLNQDVVQMQHMINEYLAFTHGTKEEETSTTDIALIARELKEEYQRSKASLHISTPETLLLSIRSIAFKRLLTNLIDNAFRYGNHCQLTARKSGIFAEITIEDNGPGIPPDRREEALRPFTRLDPARNLNTSGVGLGLAVAQDIANSHGGSLELGESALGGLKVTIRLPI